MNAVLITSRFVPTHAEREHAAALPGWYDALDTVPTDTAVWTLRSDSTKVSEFQFAFNLVCPTSGPAACTTCGDSHHRWQREDCDPFRPGYAYYPRSASMFVKPGSFAERYVESLLTAYRLVGSS